MFLDSSPTFDSPLCHCDNYFKYISFHVHTHKTSRAPLSNARVRTRSSAVAEKHILLECSYAQKAMTALKNFCKHSFKIITCATQFYKFTKSLSHMKNGVNQLCSCNGLLTVNS